MRLDKYAKSAIIRAIMEDVPKPDVKAYRKTIQAEIVKLMSPAVRKVYKECPDALVKEYNSELYDGVDWDSRYVVVGNVPKDQFSAIFKPLSDAIRAREKVQSDLRGVVESASTLKRLKELLPEFVKYFPTETEPAKNVPAIANLVTDLTKLGWPDKKKKVSAK